MLTTLEYECGWMGPGKPDETDITLLTAHVSDGPAGAIPPLPAKPRTIEALGEPVVPRRFVLTESMGGMDHNNMSTSSDSMAMKSQIIEHEKDGKVTRPAYRAWKDTVNIVAGETVRILLR
ncbi:cupredoxin domain-containing protein [Brucella grignonensis]|nr:hypothetical protein [Brucella grignonensis]